MRPKKLEMTAFGSYAEKTTVDFDALGDGIYLVTGDTGAGKTTIFDAIMFALYGETDKRDLQMLHSDYVDKSVDTAVSLEFETMGKVYRVERRLHYTKNRGGGYSETPVHSATLSGGDMQPLEKKVKERVTELIGLDSAQFRSIVMLPQGEFKKFLLADSDVREAILGKLFDNRRYNVFQESLKEAAAQMKEQRADRERSVREKMSGFVLPEGLTEAQRAQYDPDNPEFIAALEQCLSEDNSLLDKLKEKQRGLGEKRDKLNERITDANRINGLLSEQANARESCAALAAQQEEMQRLEQEAARFEKALHGVLPEMRKLEELLSGAGELKEAIEVLEGEAVMLGAERELRQKDADESRALEKTLEERIKPSISGIERSLPAYNEADELKKQLDIAGSELSALEAQKSAAEESRRSLNERRAELEESIAGIGDPERAELELTSRLKELTARLESLNAIKSGADDLCGKEALLAEATSLAKQLTNELNRSAAEYTAIYDAFISDQAGLLSDELRKKIESSGSGVCPVCGTKVCSVQHLPVAKGDNIDKEAVDEAAEKLEAARDRLNKNESSRAALELQVKEKSSELEAAAEKLFGKAVDCEALMNSDITGIALAEGEAEKRGIEDSLKECADDKKRLAQLKTQAQSAENELAAAEKTLGELTEKLSASREKCSALSARYDEKRSGLEFGTGAAAQEKLNELTAQRDSIAKRIEAARAALEETDRKIAVNTASLKDSRGRLQESEHDCGRQSGKYDAALRENGFESREAFLSVIGDDCTSGEERLHTQKERVSAYERELHAAKDRLERAEAAAKGLAAVDTDELTEQKAALDGEIAELGRSTSAQETKCSINSGVIDGIKKKRGESERENSAYEWVRKLSELAMPSSGVRLTFARYVTQSIFREILSYANIRLSEVSRGRYSFVHETEALRGNSAAGLELSILDNRTGTRRRAKAISGGESFLASLSLALGLSDAVQNRAGGMVDSMFIDEGFGSLDDANLDKAVEVLSTLAGGSRQIGIISHVEKLEESIPRKLLVKSREGGSTINVIV